MDKPNYTTKEFKFICELIWGGVPRDRLVGEGSSLFKERAPKILEEYPLLDKSFFENNKH